MLIALYTGNHSKDAWNVRLGWWLTRLVQKGQYGRVTHCEAILRDYGRGGRADIASSSVRDGGVRIKADVALDPASWIIVRVPEWSEDFARDWFVLHEGAPYDWLGAWATVMPGHHGKGFFCNEAVAASVGLLDPFIFTPSQFAAICLTLGRDVTSEFFNPQQ